MSSGHVAIQKALRTRLLTLSVCTTGTTTLSATLSGYARATGSFITDGFAVGMEVQPSGFAANSLATITAVTATTMAIRQGVPADGASAGRSLTVGLPFLRAWENLDFKPIEGLPYMEEQYLPGPEHLANDGYAGLKELRPMYAPRIYVPANVGISADGSYADAIRALFVPGTTLPLGTGESCVVSGNPAPYCGQRAKSATEGWSTIPVTIPLRALVLSSPS